MREGRHPSYKLLIQFVVVVAQLHPTVCDPMDCNLPDFTVLGSFLEFAQTHVHEVSDTIQPSHPLSSPSLSALNLSQHQSFPVSQPFASGGQSIGALASASGNLVKFNAAQTSTWDGRSSLINWKAEMNKLPPNLN